MAVHANHKLKTGSQILNCDFYFFPETSVTQYRDSRSNIGFVMRVTSRGWGLIFVGRQILPLKFSSELK